MKTLEVTKAKGSLAKYAKRVRREPLVLTERGKPVAALVSIPNGDRETVSLSNNPKFIALIQRSRAQQRKKGGHTTKEVRKMLGL